MTSKKDEKDEKKAKAEAEEAEEQAAEEPQDVQPAELAEAGDPQPNPNVVDDGVEDIELGPPQVGQFVQILSGDYQGHFAVYLGNVSMEADDDATKPAVIQVRTRDADNVLLDLPYSDVSSTTYSGGR